jgi:hypothetical protein
MLANTEITQNSVNIKAGTKELFPGELRSDLVIIINSSSGKDLFFILRLSL